MANTNPVIKLTLVSIIHGRIKVSRFVNALYVDGKTYVSREVYEKLRKEASLKRELLPPSMRVRSGNPWLISPQVIYAHQESYDLK